MDPLWAMAFKKLRNQPGFVNLLGEYPGTEYPSMTQELTGLVGS